MGLLSEGTRSPGATSQPPWVTWCAVSRLCLCLQQKVLTLSVCLFFFFLFFNFFYSAASFISSLGLLEAGSAAPNAFKVEAYFEMWFVFNLLSCFSPGPSGKLLLHESKPLFHVACYRKESEPLGWPLSPPFRHHRNAIAAVPAAG